MILILKNIANTTRVIDVEDFLHPALMGGFLKKAGNLESISIKQFQTPGLRESQYHAIVEIKPDAVARRVIKTLNRKRCNGRPINIAEYIIRFRNNDSRSSCKPYMANQRQGDRRRQNLQVTDITKERNGQSIQRLDFSLHINSNPFENISKI